MYLLLAYLRLANCVLSILAGINMYYLTSCGNISGDMLFWSIDFDSEFLRGNFNFKMMSIQEKNDV